MDPYVHCSIICNSQEKEATQGTDIWMDKEDTVCVHTHTHTHTHTQEYYSAMKRNTNNGLLLRHKLMKFCHLQQHRCT